MRKIEEEYGTHVLMWSREKEKGKREEERLRGKKRKMVCTL